MLSARAALCLATLVLPLLPGLALAQRGVEFGYKDRIFEQKYVLPEGVIAAQLIRQQAQAAMTIGLPGFASDPRLIDAMGGQCVATFMREANAEATMQSVPLTPTQAALERLPAEARVAGPDSAQDTTAQMLAEASPQEACLAQEMLFRAAFEDSLATDRQLANLAQQMRQRFAGVWMTPAQVRDPAFRIGAQRARLMGLRARRLQAIDPTKVGLSAQGMTADLIAVMRQMADTPTFEQMAAELTALEAEMLEEAQARGGTAQAEQRRKAEDAARQDEIARQAEIARDAEERRVREEEARAQDARAREEERVRRYLQGQPASPNDTGGSHPSQRQASLQPSPEPDAQEMARQRQEADRLAQIRQLEGRQAELDRRIARLEDRLAGQQGAMLRNPLNVHGAFAGVAGLSQTQAEIDRARAERLEVTRALQRLRKAAAASPANMPSAGQPMAAGDGECRPGGTCPVLSLTLFCRTPQQLVAILSQRPGPGRKQVLNVLSASGDCRQVPAGQPLQWTAPMVVVHPQGEPAAELVPGTLQDGMQGFMLRDGVMPRTRDAAR